LSKGRLAVLNILIHGCYTEAHRCGLVREAEVPEQHLSPDGLKRKLDQLMQRLEKALDASPTCKDEIPSESRDLAAIPRWKDEDACLYWCGRVIRKFRRHPANNQHEIIEAFHQAGWPRWIVDPFRDARQLRQTLYDLNKSLAPNSIRFLGDGTGEGVRWEPVSPE
jgi:hypothetical protein